MRVSRIRSSRLLSGRGRQMRRELGPGANVELAVDTREVRLDRFHAHEEGGRDLLVRRATRREMRDLPFGGAQLSPCRAIDPNSLELEARALQPESRPELLQDPLGALECVSRLRLPLRSALDRARREQGSC